jgi:transcriptional regulator with XRE-family HTH domain
MTAEDFRAIRKALGMSQAGLAAHLGYNGAKQTLCVAVSRLERGYRPITQEVAEKIIALKKEGEVDDHHNRTPPMRAPSNNTGRANTTQEGE